MVPRGSAFLLAVYLHRLVAVAGLAAPREALSSAPQQRRNAVFTTACGYSLPKLYPFVTSLRRTGYNGSVVVATASNLPQDLADFLTEHQVETRSALCEEQYDAITKGQLLVGLGTNRSATRQQVWAELDACGRDPAIGADLHLGPTLPGRYGGSVCQMRVKHYRQWLAHGGYDFVWLLDARDVYFEEEPFRHLSPGVSLFLDWHEDGGIPRVEMLQLEMCDPSSISIVREMRTPNVCGGTIAGERWQLLKFLDRFIETLERTRGATPLCKEQDQHALITTLANCRNSAQCRSDLHIQFYDHFEGPALNTQRLCNDDGSDFPKSHLDERGRPINKQGHVISVLHKWDMCPYLSRRVRKLKLVVDD